MMKHSCLPVAAFLAAGLIAGAATAAAPTCELESIRAIAPKDVVVDSVKHLTATVNHCEVLGHFITQNPGPNRVEWALMLPDRHFAGRYYFVGEGGGAGVVPTSTMEDPLNAFYVTSTLKLLSQGFAVSGTDTGHKGIQWDFGANDPTKRLDYGHRGAHLTNVATTAMTKAYYGWKDKLYRYHLGCSGGGRMGMMAALHHPEDYDGIVASTVAKSGGALYFGVIAQHIVKNPDAWVSPEKLAFLERKVDEKCAGPDGLVRDPYGCGFDVTTLQCKGPDKPDCLTAAEVSTVKVITGRFKLGHDEDSDVPGFSISNPTGWSSFLIGPTRPTNTGRENPWAPAPSPSSYWIVQSIARGFYFDDTKFDVINDLDYKNKETLDRMTERHPGWSVTTPDLSGLKKAGGKLIMWAPLSENAVPPATELEYFEQIKKKVPNADDFVRVYAAPGVYHCSGGPGPQDTPDRLLEAVIDWAEQGRRPNEIITTASTPRLAMGPDGKPVLDKPIPSRTVLLCPYPQKAVFAGKKNAFPYDARNWKCQ